MYSRLLQVTGIVWWTSEYNRWLMTNWKSLRIKPDGLGSPYQPAWKVVIGHTLLSLDFWPFMDLTSERACWQLNRELERNFRRKYPYFIIKMHKNPKAGIFKDLKGNIHISSLICIFLLDLNIFLPVNWLLFIMMLPFIEVILILNFVLSIEMEWFNFCFFYISVGMRKGFIFLQYEEINKMKYLKLSIIFIMHTCEPLFNVRVGEFPTKRRRFQNLH